MDRDSKSRRAKSTDDELLKPRDAALELRIGFPTIKQWIYQKKISERAGRRGAIIGFPKVKWTDSYSGLEPKLRRSGTSSCGVSAGGVNWSGEQRITSIITANSARKMNLRAVQTAAALIKATEVMILRVRPFPNLHLQEVCYTAESILSKSDVASDQSAVSSEAACWPLADLDMSGTWPIYGTISKTVPLPDVPPPAVVP